MKERASFRRRVLTLTSSRRGSSCLTKISCSTIRMRNKVSSITHISQIFLTEDKNFNLIMLGNAQIQIVSSTEYKSQKYCFEIENEN
jgi:hypothetical protein